MGVECVWFTLANLIIMYFACLETKRQVASNIIMPDEKSIEVQLFDVQTLICSSPAELRAF